MSLAQNHYRTMPFTHTPLNALKGVSEYNNTKDSIALYHFRKERGKLRSIIYELNGQPKPIYENYTCSNFIWAAKNLFDYKKGEIFVQHLNYLSLPIKDKPSFSRYLLDEEGRAVSLKYYDDKNSPAELNGIHEYYWKYFDDGNVGEVRFSIRRKVMPMNNWFPYLWVVLNFDDNQNLEYLMTTNENWQASKDAIKINFDIINDEITKWVARKEKTKERTNNTGPKVSEVRYDYDNNGYLIRTRFYNSSGDRIESSWGHMGFVRAYNFQGNRLSYNFIDKSDEIVLAAERGYSGQKFIWDTEGRFRLQTYYMSETGTPIFRASSGYAQIQFIYDYTGAKIGQIYKDEEGNLICSDKLQSYILLDNVYGVKYKKNICD